MGRYELSEEAKSDLIRILSNMALVALALWSLWSLWRFGALVALVALALCRFVALSLWRSAG